MEGVADFYNGKSVLVTGAAGFVAEILVEALLRCCPGLKTVYGIVRDKRGVTAKERKETLLKKRFFDKLRETSPKSLDKFQVIVGDISLPDFGMNDSDLKIVLQEVSVVFHVAACISFTKTLKHLFMHNSISTHYAIELCKKMKNMEALVYTSTAFSNSNRKTEIKEVVYRLPFFADEFIHEILNGTDSSLEQLISECQPAWPNPYTLSKNLAENILNDNASNFKVAIVRPSMVSGVSKEPLFGFVEDSSGLTLLTSGAAKGFIRVAYGDPQSKLDFIPVDIVANSHIVAAYLVAKERVPSPFVVNSVSYGKVDITVGLYQDGMMKATPEDCIPKSYQEQNRNLRICKSRWLYLVISLYEHYIPAYALDALIKLSGKKPRIVHLYKFFDKAMLTTYYFLTNSWVYETRNNDKLDTMISKEEREIFYTADFIKEVDEMARGALLNSPMGDWSTDDKSKEERKKIVRRRTMLVNSIKAAAVISFVLILYLVISLFYKLL